MKKAIFLVLFISLFLLIYADLDRVIDQTNISELNALSVRFYNEWKQKHDEALLKAEQRDIPVIIDDEGVYMELSYFDDLDLPIYHIIHNSNAAITISTDHVYPGGIAGLSLTGSGIVVREWDGGGVRLTHQEFGSRIVQVDGPITSHYHSTHVAGTIMASGVVANAKGMAYGASLRAFDWDSDTSEMATEATAGMLLSNHSYGLGRGWVWTGSTWAWYGQSSPGEDWNFGHYNSNSQDFDLIAYDAPYYLIVESAGNDRGDGPGDDPTHADDGPYDCLADMAASKNVLTVAAVEDLTSTYSQPSDVVMSTFSSWGPCDDGRIKPDISANGVALYSTDDDSNTDYTTLSGTSMAAPSVTGSLALIQEHNEEVNGVYLRSSTLKALTIHCADEAGSNDGPDYEFGWGLMNTERMAQYISDNGTDIRILETTLTNSGSYQISLPALGSEPFKATLCWTDPEGTPVTLSLDPSDPMLINDLDLRITKDASTYYPWKLDRLNPGDGATNSGDNSVDNVEQVYIENPTVDIYTITVTHKGTLVDDTGSPASQQFGLIISGIGSPVPDVSVNPTSFNQTLGLNGSDQSTLSISNNGEASSTLNYEVFITASGSRIGSKTNKGKIDPKMPIPNERAIILPDDFNGDHEFRETTIAYHDGLAYGISFTNSPGEFNCAARFTSSELSLYYTDYQITQVNFVLLTSDYTNCIVKVWEGGSLGNSGNLIYSQSVTVNEGGWTTHELTSPITLISSNEYWVGYSLTYAGTGFLFGADDGLMIADKGGLVQYNSGSWSQISTSNKNWCIEMIIDENPPDLTLTSPNGSENWANGSSRNITWSHFGAPLTDVKLEVSTNNGAGYSEITASTPNDGTYEWTVDGTASEQCLVRISDPADAGINDVSNANFRIYETVSWLTSDQDNGSIGQGSSDNVTLTYNAAGLSAGVYNADIEIISNDPDEGSVLLPVVLTVVDNISHGTGSNGTGSGPALVNMPDTNIDGFSVNPDVTIDPSGDTGIIVNVTVTDALQSSYPVPNVNNVIISYLIEVIGNTNDLPLEVTLSFNGLEDLAYIHWLNGSNWEIPGGISWNYVSSTVSCNITLPVTRDGTTEIILGRDNPLPVTLSSFFAQYEDGGSSIFWTTQSEINNLGWNLYRSPSQNMGQSQLLNAEMIPGAGTSSQPVDYQFADGSGSIVPGFKYWYSLESVDLTGEVYNYGSISLEIPQDNEDPNIPDIPVEYGLLQNHPNPFNPDTEISFNLEKEEFVSLKIYDIKGNFVNTIIEAQHTSGLHEYLWDGKNIAGKQMSSGIYLYHLESESHSSSKKMILLK